MAESQYTAPATYTITFPSLSEAEVKVSVNGAELSTSNYSISGYSTSGSGTVSITSTVDNGDIVRIFRDTSITTSKATFAPGASIKANDLNNNNTQLRYKTEEKIDSSDIASRAVTTDAIRDYNVTTAKIKGKNVTTSKIDDNAVTSAKIADGTIVNADINANANIAGSKLADNSVDLDKIVNADVVETSGYSSNWASDDTKIATVGSLAARHDIVVNADINPPSTNQTGKQWLSIAPGNQVHKIYDGTGWRTVAVGQPYSPLTTTIVRYVDTTNGSDASDVSGFLPQQPLKSIGRAIELVNASSSGDGTLIKVEPGVYQETLPLRLKKNNVSIVGTSMRSCFIHPTVATENNDMFEVDSGSYIANFTMCGLKVPTANQGSRNNSLDNDATYGLPSNQPFAVRFRTDVAPVILKSPYVQNCSHFSDAHFDNANFDPNTFQSTDSQTYSAVAGDESSAPTGGGLLVDGGAVSASSPIRSMVVDAFTQITLDGPGILVTNNGYAQLVSFFGTFAHYHAKAKNGGQINLSNCVSDFGRYGLIADGKSPSAIATATASAANSGATTVTIGAITTASGFHGTVTRPLDHMMVTIDGVDYGVVSSTANGSGWDVVLTSGLTSNITNTTVSFALRSYISTGGHTFEFVGVGTDYGDHPDKGGVPIEANQVIELNGGKVWQSSTDHVGKFKAGDVLVVDQVSETVNLKTTNITGNLGLGDDFKITLGDSSDLEISHRADYSSQLDNAGEKITEGSASLIRDAGSGPLIFKSNSGTGQGAFQFFDSNWNPMLKIHSAGRVRLFYAGQGERLKTTSSGITITGNLAIDGTVDGRDVAADGTKLDGIETGATADQTDAEIRTLVEAATDSNVFTDADHTKLDGIATGATAYANSDVDSHLNVSTASSNEVLSWTGSDYDWVAQSGGGISGITIKEEGSSLSTAATSLDFVGTAVTASGTGADKTITITADTATDSNQTFTKAQRGSIGTLTDGSTITPDFADKNNFTVTLGGNRTLGNPSNLTAGQSGVIVINQDAAGSRTLLYASNWKFAGGTAPELSTGANDIDVLSYFVVSSTVILATLGADFS